MTMRRFETFDVLRGVAALAVIFFHLGQLSLGKQIFPRGYLAVDLFFMLSGFVVGHSYESALRAGMPWRTFAVKRLIRLYPLALLGAIVGLGVLVTKWHWYPLHVETLPNILVSGLLNSFMLPTLFGGEASRHVLFPGNPPLWSLFFEMVINLSWAWAGVRMRTWTLTIFVIVSGGIMTLLAMHFQTLNMGFDVATFAGGLARVCFGFPLGVLIFRLHGKFRLPASPLMPGLLVLVLCAVFALPPVTQQPDSPVWDIAFVLMVLPAITAIASGPSACGRIGEWLGLTSYPLYALHYPILVVMAGGAKFGLQRLNVHVTSAISISAVLLLACAALYLYDEPLRRRLSRVSLRSGWLVSLPGKSGTVHLPR